MSTNLIQAIMDGDFQTTMNILKYGPKDENMDLEKLKVEINRCHFSCCEFNTIWKELERVYPYVTDFWVHFDKCEHGFPFISKDMEINKLQGIYFGAIYHGRQDVVNYIDSIITFEKTPDFLEWFEQSNYQAQASIQTE